MARLLMTVNIMRRGFAGMNAHHLAVAFPKLKVGVPWPPATQELVGLNCRITLWSCPFFRGKLQIQVIPKTEAGSFYEDDSF